MIPSVGAKKLFISYAQESSQKSKQETHKLHASSLGNGVNSQPKVPDKSQDKTTGDIKDDDSNDDNRDDVSNDDDDDDNVDNDINGDNKAKYEEEYVCTPDNYEFFNDDEEYEELYKDVNVRLKESEHEEEGKGDVEMTDAGPGDGSQEKSYEQVKDDAHVTLTAAHVTQKTEGPM
nr:hypothetical protein [Tanacetum cinerariifolium]